MRNNYSSLIRRIARLVKEKNELADNYEKLLKEHQQTTEQNERFRELLSKVSPEQIEQSLTVKKQHNLKLHMVTVLYAGISGWKNLNTVNGDLKTMDEVDTIYFQFDKIAKKHNVKRFKTIGDTFMYAGGVPDKNMTNPVDIVLTAIEMQNFIECNLDNNTWSIPWKIKIGVHTGPVHAIVKNQKKGLFELHGDTLNIASRLQSMAHDGDIFLSVATNELVKEFITTEYSHKLPVKYTNDLEVFKIKGILTILSVGEKGKVPNKLFNTRYGLLQFTDIQEIILDKLEKELPGFLYYHNVKHTVDVVTQVELIGLAEGVNDQDLLNLKMAALFHDAGHTVNYDNHEEEGCLLADHFLTPFGYGEAQLNIIKRLIMATKLPPKPKNILEKIMCDADLDYLGRIDMIPVSNTLYKELKEQQKIDNIDDWNRLQVKFISGHQYFTKTAQKLREVNKQKQIERINKLLQ